MRNYFLCAIIVTILSNKYNAQISSDAVQLTLRQQTSGVWIDSAYAVHIDSLLTIARTASDSLDPIYVFPTVNPKSITIYTNASWSNAWRQGQLLTGDEYVDSLTETYFLVSVSPPPSNWNWFDLYFQFALNTPALAEVYNLHPQIFSAYANSYGGDGDDIIYFEKNDVLYFVFSHGWGDCPAGCSNRHNYYVNLIPEQEYYSVSLVDEAIFPDSILKIYLWNEPPLYEMTMFQNAEEILDSILNNQNWWVRRHAIEGVWRFFENEYPWAANDEGPQFYFLKGDLFLLRDEVISTLLLATGDIDTDVRNSAIFALEKLGFTNIEDGENIPTKFSLSQNFPNPFNPVTTIKYTIPNVTLSGVEGSRVTLKVYDILGSEVATLVNEEQGAGNYKVEFNVAQSAAADHPAMASGIYFYRLQAGSFVETKKMVLIK
jgi:hypothetical protein